MRYGMSVVIAALVMLAALAGARGAESGDVSPLPEGLKGFHGYVAGTLISKGTDTCVVKVDKILKTWEKNKATAPESAVGKSLKMDIAAATIRPDDVRKDLAAVAVGDKVKVDLVQVDAGLVIQEAIKKQVEEPR